MLGRRLSIIHDKFFTTPSSVTTNFSRVGTCSQPHERILQFNGKQTNQSQQTDLFSLPPQQMINSKHNKSKKMPKLVKSQHTLSSYQITGYTINNWTWGKEIFIYFDRSCSFIQLNSKKRVSHLSSSCHLVQMHNYLSYIQIEMEWRLLALPLLTISGIPWTATESQQLGQHFTYINTLQISSNSSIELSVINSIQLFSYLHRYDVLPHSKYKRVTTPQQYFTIVICPHNRNYEKNIYFALS